MKPQRKRRIVPGMSLPIGLATALLALPAVAPSQTTQSLEQRVAKMERMLESGTLLRLLQSVEELKAEVRELRGQLERQQYSLSQMSDRQKELYLDVDRRLQRVETAGMAAGTAAGVAATGAGSAPSGAARAPTASAAGSTGGTSSSTGTAAVGVAAAGAATQASTPQPAAIDPVKEQQAYQAAFNLLKAGRYDQAGKSFQKFLDEYPTSKFADNAQYWLGESYYVTRDFNNAMREFETLVKEHPDSQKLTHALLKVGYIHDELGRKDQAREVLTELIEKYPQSTAAGLAEKRLQRMGN